MLVVPLTADADSRLQIRLGDNTLSLRTYFVPAPATWFMDITGTDGVPLVTGLALVPWVNVLGASPELTRSLGEFRVLPNDAGDENTNQDAIAPLWWFAPGELEALGFSETGDMTLPFDASTMYSMIPDVPPSSVPLVVLLLAYSSSRLYRLVNTDFYPRLN